jgi:putative protease
VEYAAKITEIFRKAIDLYYEGKLTEDIKEQLYRESELVYNRGLSDGFYFAEPDENYWAGISGNKSSVRKEYVGYVENYFAKSKIVHLVIQNSSIAKGDKLLAIGETTGAVELLLDEFFVNDMPSINFAQKGDFITLKSSIKLRRNDKVYKVIEFDRAFS